MSFSEKMKPIQYALDEVTFWKIYFWISKVTQ